jgi:hypothetical protein
MTEEQIALARRAVACKGWRWMPGMADHWGQRLREGQWVDPAAALPDLTDPATLGCVLALVREAWGNPHIWVESCVDREMWSSIDHYGLGWACPNGEPVVDDIEGATEAEALVAALEAAP